MNVDGFVRVTNGKNAAGGDLLRLVLWLANEAQSRTGGLLAGQWITTGSWTGKILADSGSVALARFLKFGEVPSGSIEDGLTASNVSRPVCHRQSQAWLCLFLGSLR